ncbi:MAG TPA: FMN-binding glutamate synthase family protein [Chitinophagaceae bacterium]
MWKHFSARAVILIIILALNLAVAVAGGSWLWGLLFTVPLLALALSDLRQRRHAIMRNYPVIGHLRYFLESIRPEIRQYFFESDLDGAPFNRRQRSIVYQRAKNEKQTVAFGMQADPTAPGYEWVAHSVYPSPLAEEELRVTIGNYQCAQPYRASVFNIGAMSYGALSKTAIEALNRGARLGGFAHNTGEGGISDYHLQGGDLVWQIGTGYFGCRNAEGRFHPLAFRKNALRPEVKMIELKLSQGAKPGHGGILPAGKNTPEVAAIRGVTAGTTVHSPAHHSEFSDAEGLVHFLQLLRELSEGKPVGFKMCIGDKSEFIDICRAMSHTGILPDFISIDGAEGGTGAAPLEFTDHLGMPLYEAVAFVRQSLDHFGLSEHVKIVAAGKIITGFDLLKVIALGASAVYSARGMMMALGCIQALICDSGRCPVGVATQDPALASGLDPADKSVRVANYHAKTLAATREIMEACGFSSLEKVSPSRFFRRVNEQQTRSFEQIYFSHGDSTAAPRLKSLLN